MGYLSPPSTQSNMKSIPLVKVDENGESFVCSYDSWLVSSKLEYSILRVKKHLSFLTYLSLTYKFVVLKGKASFSIGKLWGSDKQCKREKDCCVFGLWWNTLTNCRWSWSSFHEWCCKCLLYNTQIITLVIIWLYFIYIIPKFCTFTCFLLLPF